MFYLIFHCVCFWFLCSDLYFIVFASFGFCVTLYFIVCFRFLCSPYISLFVLGFCLLLYSIFVLFLCSTVLFQCCCFSLRFCALPYILLFLLYIYVMYLIFRYHCSIFLCCTLYSVIIALYFCVVLCISFFWLYISVPWAVQARLLTPLTFAQHRLSPLAAFTSAVTAEVKAAKGLK